MVDLERDDLAGVVLDPLDVRRLDEADGMIHSPCRSPSIAASVAAAVVCMQGRHVVRERAEFDTDPAAVRERDTRNPRAPDAPDELGTIADMSAGLGEIRGIDDRECGRVAWTVRAEGLRRHAHTRHRDRATVRKSSIPGVSSNGDWQIAELRLTSRRESR